MLTDALAARCDAAITTGKAVTRVVHDGTSVTGVVVGEQLIRATELISTVPLDRLVGLLDPPPHRSLLAQARDLSSRSSSGGPASPMR